MAFSTPSATWLKRSTVSTGPKISSLSSRGSRVPPASTVGSTYAPVAAVLHAPASDRDAVAIARELEVALTRSSCRSEISGPISAEGSSGAPTVTAAARSHTAARTSS